MKPIRLNPACGDKPWHVQQLPAGAMDGCIMDDEQAGVDFRQFSHDALSGEGGPPPYARQLGPVDKRPQGADRREGAGCGRHTRTAKTPEIWRPSELYFQLSPERRPDKFGPRAQSNQKICQQFAVEFFRDGIKRARERNNRLVKSIILLWWDLSIIFR